jgi:hypothetical protein
VQAIDLTLKVGARGPGATLALRREGAAWRITAPADAVGPADDSAVRELVGEWEKLRARGFGPAGDPVGSLRLRTGSDEVAVEIGKTASALTARRVGEDEALLLPARTLALFDADPLALRARRVLSFSSGEVRAITIDRGGARVTVEPAAERWGPLLTALTELRVQKWMRREFAARGSLTVELQRGPSPSLVLGPNDEDGCLVRLPGDPSSVAGLLSPEVCALLWR